MATHKHSGALGDLIYSLSVVRKMGGGSFLVALNNLINTGIEYGYRPEHLSMEHDGRLTVEDYTMLRPLLERQSYITDAGIWNREAVIPDVDLDRFRAVLFRSFEGNYVEAYHRTFNIPFKLEDYDLPWLEADATTVRPIVVSRTARYRDPNGESGWRDVVGDADLANNGIFVGTPGEHRDFQAAIGIEVPYHPVQNFLELANVVAGAELVVANQNFVYSLAMGLGKATVLETNKSKPLQNNECFFPRTNCQYF